MTQGELARAALADKKRRVSQVTDGSIRTVSYSGADYKAIVFLPINMNGIASLQKKYEEERDKVKQELNTILCEHQAYQRELELAVEKTKVAYDLWVATQEQEDYDKYIKCQFDEKSIMYSMYSQLSGRKSILSLQDQLNNIDDQIKQLSELRSKAPQDAKDGYIGNRAITLGDVQTISYSIHREKFPVRTLGRVAPKSRTRGPRTIAGSIIFTVLHKQALGDIIQIHNKYYNTGVTGSDATAGAEYVAGIPDQLPPFDITIVAANEVGDVSYMVLYGVDIVNEGQTMSIQDMITENVMQFTALDIQEMQPLGSRNMQVKAYQPYKTVTATELALAQKGRLDPFI